jgi:hypothetical protein
MAISMTYRSHSGRLIPPLISLAIACAVVACSSKTTQMSDATPTPAFLPQPVLLQPGQSGQPSMVYLNPQMARGGYNKVILDPVTIWTDDSSKLQNLSIDQQQALAETFNSHVYEAISAECHMTTMAGLGTIRIRLALTDARRDEPKLNTISNYIANGEPASSMAIYDFNDSAGLFAGSAAAEGYAVDSKTGTLLWEGVDRRAAQNAVGTDGFNSWDDVDNAFIAWSKQFATRLKQLGICP